MIKDVEPSVMALSCQSFTPEYSDTLHNACDWLVPRHYWMSFEWCPVLCRGSPHVEYPCCTRFLGEQNTPMLHSLVERLGSQETASEQAKVGKLLDGFADHAAGSKSQAVLYRQ